MDNPQSRDPAMVQRAESMYGELPCVLTHFPVKGRARHAFNCFLQTRTATASPRAGTNTHVPPCRHPPGHVPRDVCSMHTLQLTTLQTGTENTLSQAETPKFGTKVCAYCPIWHSGYIPGRAQPPSAPQAPKCIGGAALSHPSEEDRNAL